MPSTKLRKFKYAEERKNAGGLHFSVRDGTEVEVRHLGEIFRIVFHGRVGNCRTACSFIGDRGFEILTELDKQRQR